jgi:RimJ/RimL family protein N-acetyltransferase
MEIRLMNINDIPFFNKVRNSCVDFLHDNTKYSITENETWFNKLKDPFFIMLVNNEKIGYIRTSNWENNEPYVGMDIANEFRGKGYSKLFYKLLFDLLSNDYNIKRIQLEVLESNKRAKHIYDSLGFSELSVKKYKETNTIKMFLNI